MDLRRIKQNTSYFISFQNVPFIKIGRDEPLLSFLSQIMHITKPSYPLNKNKNVCKIRMNHWKHRRRVSVPWPVSWVSSRLSMEVQYIISNMLPCSLFLIVLRKTVSTFPSSTQVNHCFLHIISITKHCQVLHLSHFCLIWEKRIRVKSCAFAFRILLSPICKDTLHFSCGVTV